MSVTTAEVAEKKNNEFFYKVLLKNGRTETGTAFHPSKDGLIAKLARNPDYQDILVVRPTSGNAVGKKARPKARSLVAMSRQLELCLQVGMDTRDALTLIRSGDINDPVLDHGLSEVIKAMGDGIKMSEAMSRLPYIFPQIMIETIRSGEKTDLSEAASRVADDLEASDEQRAKIKKATTYPLVLAAVSSMIFIFMMVYVVPQFAIQYKNLSGGRVGLPALTQAVMVLSDQMMWGVPTLAIVGVVTYFWYRRNSQETKVREFVDPLKLKLPVFGTLFHKIALTRFCRTLASLSDNSIHIVDALEITSGSVGNITMERAILNARDAKNRGEQLLDPLEKEPLFPKLLIQFLSIGEATGKMGDSLRSICKLYERDVDSITNRMEALIQPIFLVVIGAMVAIIALAVYLPYFNLGDAVSPY